MWATRTPIQNTNIRLDDHPIKRSNDFYIKNKITRIESAISKVQIEAKSDASCEIDSAHLKIFRKQKIKKTIGD